MGDVLAVPAQGPELGCPAPTQELGSSGVYCSSSTAVQTAWPLPIGQGELWVQQKTSLKD